MSNYPAWWDATITVYNQHTDPTTRVTMWYRTVIPNCFWKQVGSKVSIGSVVLDTESITCRIPQQSNYLSPDKWVNVPNDQKGKYFTLQQGDIVICGDVDDEINEYVSGQRKNDLVAKYRLMGCIEVKDVAINTQTLMINPHYRVVGK